LGRTVYKYIILKAFIRVQISVFNLRNYALDGICRQGHNLGVSNWKVNQTVELETWFLEQDEDAKEDILASVKILSEIGPTLGRPHVDTLAGTAIKNLKELRIQSNGRPFRVLFVFDPKRTAILLFGGNKEGNERFYEMMIPKAESLYREYLKENGNEIKNKKKSGKSS
jgi:hypothetical protein